MTPPAPKKATGPGEQPFDRQDLLKAYKDVVQEEQEKRSNPGGEVKPGRWAFWLLTLGLLGISAGSLVLHPEWFFPQERVETPQLEDASLRLIIYREILHIEQYRRTNGRLPTSLKDAGGADVGVEYTVNGNGYVLKGRNGALQLTYDSGTPAAAFVGDSYERVQRRNH